jgi:arsenical pump membrane protein
MRIADGSTVLIWTISLSSIVCMLLRPRRIAEAYWACGGAMVLVLARLIPLSQAAHAIYQGWNVYLFLTGMMILAELARAEGVFDWVADVAAQQARNSPRRLFVLIYLVGALVTALLSNDATAVVLTPAVLAVVRRAKVDPKPYLLACAFIANAASFVLPISNPASLVIFDRQTGQHMPPLALWLRIFFLPSLVCVSLTFLCLRWVLRKELGGKMPGEVQPVLLATKGKLALAGLVVAAAALVSSSALGLSLGGPTCGAAVLAVALVAWLDRSIPLSVAKGMSWSVLPLVAGLYVIVEALERAGLLGLGFTGLRALAETTTWVAKAIAAFAVALLSNGMNNLPVALLSGAAIEHGRETSVVAHAILIGVDLGPNLSVTGSLATILWLIALRREKVEIAAWEFFKIGIVAMPVALIGSLLVLRN